MTQKAHREIDPDSVATLLDEEGFDTVAWEPRVRANHWPTLGDFQMSLLPMPEATTTLPPEHVSLDMGRDSIVSLIPMPARSDSLTPDHVSLYLEPREDPPAGGPGRSGSAPVALASEYTSLHLEPPRSIRSRFRSLMPEE